MKCTLTTLLLHQNRFFINHVGDSKIFLLRQDRMLQLTGDHNLAGKLLRLGLITAEDARHRAQKNILLKAVGESPLLVPDFYSGIVKPDELSGNPAGKANSNGLPSTCVVLGPNKANPTRPM